MIEKYKDIFKSFTERNESYSEPKNFSISKSFVYAVSFCSKKNRPIVLLATKKNLEYCYNIRLTTRDKYYCSLISSLEVDEICNRNVNKEIKNHFKISTSFNTIKLLG